LQNHIAADVDQTPLGNGNHGKNHLAEGVDLTIANPYSSRCRLNNSCKPLQNHIAEGVD
jgi:hypothetical protein